LHKTSEWNAGQRLLLVIVCLLVILQIACGLTPLTFYDLKFTFTRAGGIPESRPPRSRSLECIDEWTNGTTHFGMSWIAAGTGGAFRLLMAGFGCLPVFAAARIGSEIGRGSAIARVGSPWYFRLSDQHLSRFYQWLHTLPLVFDDHRRNVLLSV
jgi:hypothetical protein